MVGKLVTFRPRRFAAAIRAYTIVLDCRLRRAGLVLLISGPLDRRLDPLLRRAPAALASWSRRQ